MRQSPSGCSKESCRRPTTSQRQPSRTNFQCPRQTPWGARKQVQRLLASIKSRHQWQRLIRARRWSSSSSRRPHTRQPRPRWPWQPTASWTRLIWVTYGIHSTMRTGSPRPTLRVLLPTRAGNRNFEAYLRLPMGSVCATYRGLSFSCHQTRLLSVLQLDSSEGEGGGLCQVQSDRPRIGCARLAGCGALFAKVCRARLREA